MTARKMDPELYALMTNPATHGGEPVQVIETHAACVFLAGDRAYKLKRPVNYGYLDFSTPQARAAALQAELRLNAPNAPSLYRRILWIGRDHAGALRLGAGEAVEPVLEMARFDQDALLDRWAMSGRIHGAVARDLADTVFDSHIRAPQRISENEAARMRGVLDAVCAACLKEAPAAKDRIGAVQTALTTHLTAKANRLTARGRSGSVRRCHGDLHLNNIIMLDGAPVLFDALEFDETLAEIDTLYDLAFLVMDLFHRGLEVQAASLLSQYVARLEPDAADGVGLMPAFCGVRALIRAMADYERGQAQDVEDAAAYLSLAECCARPCSPQLIAIGGLSGTGKSTLAEALAAHIAPPPGALVLRADLERKAMLGLNWRDRLPEQAYTREASIAVYDRQRRKTQAALEGGASVIMDAVHSRSEERAAIEAVAADAGVRFTGFWLSADRAVVENRVAARTADPSDADLSVVAKQAAYKSGTVSWAEIDASGDASASLTQALKVLRS